MFRENRHAAIRFVMFVVMLLVGVSANAAPKIYLPQVKSDLGKALHSDYIRGSFVVANRGDEPLVIKDVASTCGCTVVDFKESTVIQPGKELELGFEIDTTGKVGEIRKMITVKSNDPDNEEVEFYAYAKVMLEGHEKVDRTAIFQGQCKYCHARPDDYLMGEELFEAVCYMCHGHYGLGGVAKRINDYAYVTNFDNEHFRQMISEGVENSSMPGFAKENGGPLDEHQIDSLVELMRWWEEGYIFKANEERLPNEHKF